MYFYASPLIVHKIILFTGEEIVTGGEVVIEVEKEGEAEAEKGEEVEIEEAKATTNTRKGLHQGERVVVGPVKEEEGIEVLVPVHLNSLGLFIDSLCTYS